MSEINPIHQTLAVAKIADTMSLPWARVIGVASIAELPAGRAEIPDCRGSAHAVGGHDLSEEIACRVAITVHLPQAGGRQGRAPIFVRNQMEDDMLFICMANWTEKGIGAVKDSPKRAKAARALAKKLGVEIKEFYLTSGESDLLLVLEAANGDAVAKFAMATGSLGSVRTKTFRAWTEAEYQKLISELP